MPKPRRIRASYQRFLDVVSDHPPLTRLFMRVASTVDPVLLKATNGRAALPIGFPVLLLRTTGARTGRSRQTPLLFTPDGDRAVVIASSAGEPRHPAWYHNLVANPGCEVLANGRSGAYTARIADGDERARLWALATSMYHGYETYQRRAGRAIPVIVLEPEAAAR